MNIVVCAKQVVDVGEIKVNPSTGKPILEGIPKKISDIDKNAAEEALRIKEKLKGKVTVITVGSEDARERIKEVLAMGADDAILIVPPDGADYHVVSNLIEKAIKDMGQVDLVLCGEASIDMFSGQMGPRIAGALGIPQLSYASKITAEADKITAERNMGDKRVVSESTYPALVTVTKEINVPRLPSLMQILGSAAKPIKIVKAADMGIPDLAPKVILEDVKGLTMNRKNMIFKDDLDQAVKVLAENLSKDGVLG